ncbi:homeobox protein Nkx-6.1-like [Anopheles aquasalis]|uniref:homeobox protein Nkx-6.1-like n=1 Tax=Anopheles aquasalis TaxID=42839 RepID=UPI00215B5388|nr:homeobox protein Nkx-6.1-like [Anopheles aquasalis]
MTTTPNPAAAAAAKLYQSEYDNPYGAAGSVPDCYSGALTNTAAGAAGLMTSQAPRDNYQYLLSDSLHSLSMPYSFHHRLPCSSPSAVQPMDLNTHSAASAAAAAAAAASAAAYSQSISMTDLSQMTPPSAVAAAAAVAAAGLPPVPPRHLPTSIITSSGAIAVNPGVVVTATLKANNLMPGVDAYETDFFLLKRYLHQMEL